MPETDNDRSGGETTVLAAHQILGHLEVEHLVDIHDGTLGDDRGTPRLDDVPVPQQGIAANRVAQPVAVVVRRYRVPVGMPRTARKIEPDMTGIVTGQGFMGREVGRCGLTVAAAELFRSSSGSRHCSMSAGQRNGLVGSRSRPIS